MADDSLELKDAMNTLADMVQVVENAIANGDWKIDGRCDPDMALYRATKILNKYFNGEW